MNGLERIQKERQRQLEEEKWDADRDDQYVKGQLAAAGFAYEMATENNKNMPIFWPWAGIWWKPTTQTRNLEKAGALYLAEIDRLKRRVELLGRFIDKVEE